MFLCVARVRRVMRSSVRVVATSVEPAGEAVLDEVPNLTRTGDGLSPSTPGLEDAEALLVSVHDEVTREVLDAAGELELVVTRSTGIDNVDLEACRERGVTATALPEYATEAVAEMVLAASTLLLRNAPEGHHRARSGRWDRSGLLSRSVADATVGVVGVGRIGKEVARRFCHRGARVLGYDIEDYPGFGPEGFTWVDTLEDALAESDLVTFHVPLDGTTRGMVDRKTLAMLPEGAVLVNAARGHVVETDALLEALESGHLGGVYLDVVAGEGSGEPPLLEAVANHPRVLVTPHLAAFDEGTVRARYELAVELLDAHLGSQPER